MFLLKTNYSCCYDNYLCTTTLQNRACTVVTPFHPKFFNGSQFFTIMKPIVQKIKKIKTKAEMLSQKDYYKHSSSQVFS